jgi:hypothetical protein
MAPEYAMRGIFSVKSDVYSFGVLTLEVVSGVKISSTDHMDEYENLIVKVSICILNLQTVDIKLLCFYPELSCDLIYLFRHGTYGTKGTSRIW